MATNDPIDLLISQMESEIDSLEERLKNNADSSQMIRTTQRVIGLWINTLRVIQQSRRPNADQ